METLQKSLPTELIDRLKSAKRVVVLTGAGLSAESGLPTFRGDEGLWKKYKALDLASLDGFRQRPQVVWDWYEYRRSIYAKARPNPGHLALTELEKFYPEFTLITQNTDGLHFAAGSESMLELHGNIRRNRCHSCGKLYPEKVASNGQIPPRCGCGGMLRPDVVWFGEPLSPSILDAAWKAASAAEIFFSIGTSALVQPAASLPLLAQRNGGAVIEINLEPTPLTPAADFFLEGKASEWLCLIKEELP
ncbi:MAG: NAD-dependent deacylase [candidate division Zixibacteria bacterium]|nr:NAD-dependent deacylase [candidate division Zixibacteria bacterium]MCI0595704.1 NAD-dependent deacylase [candidate division Zixibacteria bacterium]